MKIACITGANKGIGFAVARRLAGKNIKVFLGARHSQKGTEAAESLRKEGLDAEWLEIDVDSDTSVKNAARELKKRFGRLDILINNAGILPEVTAEGAESPLDLNLFKQTFETNFFGAVRVIQCFLPLLKKSDAGRIVNVSSTVGSMADQNDPDSPYYNLMVPAYQTSKTALNGVTISLAKYLRETSIKVNSVCPGFVQTDLTPGNRSQAPLTPEEAASIVIEMALVSEAGPTGGFFDASGSVAW